jgi:hypothetical protein
MTLTRRMLVLLLAATPAIAAPAPQVVGTWTLVSATSTDDKGQGMRAPYGKSPSGMLIYNADGSMSIVISNEGRKPLSVADREAAPAEERAQAFASFLAYSGRYKVAGDKITHHIEVSSVQNWVGSDLVRSVQVNGDRLVLRTPPTTLGGRLQIVELAWQRARTE